MLMRRLANIAGQITSISCGWRHTMAISAGNEIWAWGHAGCAFSKYMNARAKRGIADVTKFETFRPVVMPFDAKGTKRVPLKVHSAWSHTMCVTTLAYKQQPVVRMRTLSAPLLKPAATSMSPRHQRNRSDLSSVGSRTEGGSSFDSGETFRRSDPDARPGSSPSKKDDLGQLSRKQMILLASKLGEISKAHGLLGKSDRPSNRIPTSPRATSPSRLLSKSGKTRNEMLLDFLSRKNDEASPIMQAKEEGWDKFFASKRPTLISEDVRQRIDSASAAGRASITPLLRPL